MGKCIYIPAFSLHFFCNISQTLDILRGYIIIRNSIEGIEDIIFQEYIFAASFVWKKTFIEMNNHSFSFLIIVEIMYLAGWYKEQRIVAYRILLKINIVDSCTFLKPYNLVKAMYVRLLGIVAVFKEKIA